ncbi:MAG: PDZ domain-containing protein [Planctomycetota bacterium]
MHASHCTLVWMIIGAFAPALAIGAPMTGSDVLVFHEKTETKGEQEVVQAVLAAVKVQDSASIHEDGELPPTSSDPRLRVYEAILAKQARGAWRITFLRAQGVARVEAFDASRGVRVFRGTKIRSMSRDRLTEEHAARLEEMIALLQFELAEKIAVREQTRPYQESITWTELEDPPQPGFRWAFDEGGPRITFVYETSSLAAAGLRAGDRILSINGEAVPSPPHLGKMLGPLRAEDAIGLEVLRGEDTLELSGRVEASSKLIPRWQAAIVGEKAPPLGTPIGAGEGPTLERPVLLFVFEPALPDTCESLAVVRWVRDRYPPKQLAVVGVAVREGTASVHRFLEEVKPGWPVIPDPDGLLGDRLRIARTPAFLLIDRSGILRFRQIDEAHLCQAIDSL